MTMQQMKSHPRLATALQLALLIGIFQGVVATTPKAPVIQAGAVPAHVLVIDEPFGPPRQAGG